MKSLLTGVESAMPIDDPIGAAKSLIQSERRQQSPAFEMAASLAEAVLDPTKLLGFIGSRVAKWRQENCEYLLEVLADQVRRLELNLNNQVERLGWRVDTLDAEYRRFAERDFPALIVEALKQASDLRSKHRLKRVGVVLARAYVRGPSGPLDETEDMVRLATALNEDDMLILRKIHRSQAGLLMENRGRVLIDDVNHAWAQMPHQSGHLQEEEVPSICAKLQNLGLILQVARRPNFLGPNKTPYALLPKGLRLVEFTEEDGAPDSAGS